MQENKKTIVLNYGLGNAPTLANSIAVLGFDVELKPTLDEEDLNAVVFLPGVGSFDSGVDRLKKSGNFEFLKKAVLTPNFNLVGVCLGMQLLMEKSSEGTQTGLNVFDGDVVELAAKKANVGWNYVYSGSFFKEGSLAGYWPRMYFVHSYRVRVIDQSLVLAESKFMGEIFPSIIGDGQHFGIQCHPERSHADGLKLLRELLVSLKCELS